MITDVALGCEWSSGITLTDTRMDVYEGVTYCIISVTQREATLAHCPVQVQQNSVLQSWKGECLERGRQEWHFVHFSFPCFQLITA